MIRTVRLQNYMSFGESQTAQLEPITVIVGANNSGKSNFLRSFAATLGGANRLISSWHRPPFGDGRLVLGWEASVPRGAGGASERRGSYQISMHRPGVEGLTAQEEVSLDGGTVLLRSGLLSNGVDNRWKGRSIGGYALGDDIRDPLRAANSPGTDRDADDALAVVEAAQLAKFLHLRPELLRADEMVRRGPEVGQDGTGVAAVVAYWMMEFPEKIRELNSVLERCLPEIKRVLTRCLSPGMVRLHFEQTDGERFDATQVSDGVLIFTALVVRSLELGRNSLMLLEEPERGIHPRRLGELVDLMRSLSVERGMQFILATHSPELLNVFRDEPEAVLAFRRSSKGTRIRRLADMPDVVEAMRRSDPGTLLSNGIFNEEHEG